MEKTPEQRLAALRELVVAYFTAPTRKGEADCRRALMQAVAREMALEEESDAR